ncbi:hypothetical protein gpAD87_09575 [Paenibacillus sp. AD87]|nr:hypothetical protein gpAD87_09575 [Paenibacillus sp. AD87]
MTLSLKVITLTGTIVENNQSSSISGDNKGGNTNGIRVKG